MVMAAYGVQIKEEKGNLGRGAHRGGTWRPVEGLEAQRRSESTERSSQWSRRRARGRPERSEQSSWAMAPATEVEEEDRGVDAVAIPADPLAYSM